MKAVILLVAIYCGVLVPCAGFINYVNRKLTADLQARVGPNRAGPAGVLQPLADFFKSLQKEVDFKSLDLRETALFWIQSIALYATIAVLPLSSMILTVDTDMGIFLAFWAAFTVALMSLFLGLERSSVPGWLSAVRVAIQALTGAFPAILSLFCAAMQAGGLRWSQIAAAQGPFPFSWMIFRNPFECIAFFVFIVSGLILFSTAPMDTGFDRVDVVGGFTSSLFARKRTLFNFGRFYGFFLWTVIASALFLGGWNIPEDLKQNLIESGNPLVASTLEMLVILSKSLLLMVFVNLIMKVNPRGRVDQITDFSWRVLSPAALFAAMGSAIWICGKDLL
jgi:NADH-quinone oxidoreductase subunit H